MKKRTKIIATIGPASCSPSMINRMIIGGTDVFRINLSHTKINNFETVNTSSPSFLNIMKQLGANFEIQK